MARIRSLAAAAVTFAVAAIGIPTVASATPPPQPAETAAPPAHWS